MTDEKRKRVLMVLIKDFMHPYLDARVYKEARSLVAHGYDVSVACWSRGDNGWPGHERIDGIDVVRVFRGGPAPDTSLLRRLPAYGSFVLKAVRHGRRFRPDVVHCHDLDTLVVGVLLKLLRRRPLVYDAHEEFPATYRSMGGPSWISRLLRLWENLLIRSVDRVIAAERLYVDNMRRHYGKDSVVILNLPTLDTFSPDVDASPVIRRHGLEDKLVVSQIGAIGETRGTFEVLEALQSVKCDNLRLLLIGPVQPAMRDRLEGAIERLGIADKVILLLDGVPYEETPMYYRASDISLALLHPTPAYVTSVPTKLYESLAVGVPVLAADLPHIREIIEKHEVGLCADSQDPEDIAAKLTVLIADGGMRQRMGKNGAELAQRELSWRQSEETLLDVYGTLVGASREGARMPKAGSHSR